MLKSENKKQCFLVLEMSTMFSDARIHSFSYVWCNPVKSFCVMEMVHHTRYCQFVWHRRIGKCVPKLILVSWVRTRCQVVFDNEHLWKTSFHLFKDWCKQVTTWCNLCELLYGHINPIKLHWIATINKYLKMGAWLFNHPVFYGN
jgi:hypothetical protein